MAVEYTRTGELREATFRQADLHGATFDQVDLGGATIRDSDLRGLRIASSWVDELQITGFDGAAGVVVVDDVVVTDFVAAELDRRHPERVRLREVRTAQDVRDMWATIERLWDETCVRAQGLPQERRHERVHGEWSVVETLRHLVFAVDSWLGQMLRAPEPTPYHPSGLPPSDMPTEAFAPLGIDPQARPGWDEAVAAFRERRSQVREYVAGLRDEDFAQVRTGVLDPGGEPERTTVEHCLRVILREHVEHRRFAERDLEALTG